MKSFRIVLIALSFASVSGCVHSYYEYRLQPRDRLKYGASPNELVSGRIIVKYERYGIFPRYEGILRVDPEHPLLTLAILPFALCVELPFRWASEKQVWYDLPHHSSAVGLDPVFFRHPHSRLEVGSWRTISELQWSRPQKTKIRIVMSEMKDHTNCWRYKLNVSDGLGCKEIALPMFDYFEWEEQGQRGTFKSMMTFDGNVVYLFNAFDDAKFLNHFWRDDGNDQSVCLVRFDMKSGVLTKMIWFDGWTIHVSNDVELDESTYKTCHGWLYCEFEES